jgi:arylsulfatase A
MRRLLATSLLLFLAPFAAGAEPAKTAKPNIVVILSDDLGYGDLGCFGYPKIRTPHLDQLAKDGLRLTACYSSAPVCSPSRAGLFTGRQPYRYGIRDWIPANSGIFLPRRETTVASLLRAAGYRTALAGKWHLSSKMDGSEPTPGDHGFDHWFATQNNADPTHQNPTNFVRNGQKVGPLQGNSSTLIIDEALTFLKGVKDQPFALFVCFHAPHEIVATPAEYENRYRDEADETVRTYYGCVTLMDHEIGRLLKELDDRGLRDSTFVFFTSDNGPETLNRYKTANHSHGSAGPLRGMKLHLTEGGIRLPGIVRWPGHIEPGKESAEPVWNIDLLPTLCGLAGASVPADRFLDGADVRPLFAGKPIDRKTPLYWQYDKALGDWKVAIRKGDWKLLADEKLERFAFYNVAEDLGEKKDLAADPAQAERLTGLRRELQRMYQQINGGAVKRP